MFPLPETIYHIFNELHVSTNPVPKGFARHVIGNNGNWNSSNLGEIFRWLMKRNSCMFRCVRFFGRIFMFALYNKCRVINGTF